MKIDLFSRAQRGVELINPELASLTPTKSFPPLPTTPTSTTTITHVKIMKKTKSLKDIFNAFKGTNSNKDDTRRMPKTNFQNASLFEKPLPLAPSAMLNAPLYTHEEDPFAKWAPTMIPPNPLLPPFAPFAPRSRCRSQFESSSSLALTTPPDSPVRTSPRIARSPSSSPRTRARQGRDRNASHSSKRAIKKPGSPPPRRPAFDEPRYAAQSMVDLTLSGLGETEKDSLYTFPCPQTGIYGSAWQGRSEDGDGMRAYQAARDSLDWLEDSLWSPTPTENEYEVYIAACRGQTWRFPLPPTPTQPEPSERHKRWVEHKMERLGLPPPLFYTHEHAQSVDSADDLPMTRTPRHRTIHGRENPLAYTPYDSEESFQSPSFS